ncbi:MAG: GIY-YIG nuclease family protein [Chloroflexi bacterium]|nr:GIY-YIG nuclease family protein [Chloroflexota bacterium]
MKQYYVYIMASYRGTLYTGVTNNVLRRVYEHRQKVTPGFTSKYNVSKLVYYEETDDILAAIAREKQIKGWLRRKKAALIESMNPYWKDLAEGWLEGSPPPQTLRPDESGLRVTGEAEQPVRAGPASPGN